VKRVLTSGVSRRCFRHHFHLSTIFSVPGNFYEPKPSLRTSLTSRVGFDLVMHVGEVPLPYHSIILLLECLTYLFTRLKDYYLI
jgi:hypothetical protein